MFSVNGVQCSQCTVHSLYSLQCKVCKVHSVVCSVQRAVRVIAFDVPSAEFSRGQQKLTFSSTSVWHCMMITAMMMIVRNMMILWRQLEGLKYLPLAFYQKIL